MPEPMIIVDTGPLVALLVAEDPYHDWAIRQFQQLRVAPLTCEAVLAEAFFLMGRARHGTRRLMELVCQDAVRVRFAMMSHREALASLVVKYADVPMSLADACLVRMAELTPDARVMTLDSDFRIYRRHGRQVIPVIMPEGR